MKLIIILLTSNFILSYANSSCYEDFSSEYSTLYVWGDSVDVSHQNSITFIKDSDKDPANYLLFISEYAGFECFVIEMEKKSDRCLIIEVEWLPGADQSGCDLDLYYKKKEREFYKGTSHLWMSY